MDRAARRSSAVDVKHIAEPGQWRRAMVFILALAIPATLTACNSQTAPASADTETSGREKPDKEDSKEVEQNKDLHQPELSTEEEITLKTREALQEARYCQLTPNCKQTSKAPNIPYPEHTQPVTPATTVVEEGEKSESSHSINAEEEDDSWFTSEIGAGIALGLLGLWGIGVGIKRGRQKFLRWRATINP